LGKVDDGLDGFWRLCEGSARSRRRWKLIKRE
jgi:hypothetical protein